jgi:hypothetical protein
MLYDDILAFSVNFESKELGNQAPLEDIRAIKS